MGTKHSKVAWRQVWSAPVEVQQAHCPFSSQQMVEGGEDPRGGSASEVWRRVPTYTPIVPSVVWCSHINNSVCVARSDCCLIRIVVVFSFIFVRTKVIEAKGGREKLLLVCLPVRSIRTLFCLTLAGIVDDSESFISSNCLLTDLSPSSSLFMDFPVPFCWEFNNDRISRTTNKATTDDDSQ